MAQEALHFYFSDGKRLRSELIPRFIDKLKQLLNARRLLFQTSHIRCILSCSSFLLSLSFVQITAAHPPEAVETHSVNFDFIASSVLLIYEGAPYSTSLLSLLACSLLIHHHYHSLTLTLSPVLSVRIMLRFRATIL